MEDSENRGHFVTTGNQKIQWWIFIFGLSSKGVSTRNSLFLSLNNANFL